MCLDPIYLQLHPLQAHPPFLVGVQTETSMNSFLTLDGSVNQRGMVFMHPFSLWDQVCFWVPKYLSDLLKIFSRFSKMEGIPNTKMVYNSVVSRHLLAVHKNVYFYILVSSSLQSYSDWNVTHPEVIFLFQTPWRVCSKPPWGRHMLLPKEDTFGPAHLSGAFSVNYTFSKRRCLMGPEMCSWRLWYWF